MNCKAALALVAMCCSFSVSAQTLVLAGANDTPNTLINGVFTAPSSFVFNPEIPSGGNSNGTAMSTIFDTVRIYAGAASSKCSLAAQTNDASNSVSIYRLSPLGIPTPITGSPIVTGGLTQNLSWAPDGGALYVESGQGVKTLAIACVPGGAVTVTDLGNRNVTNIGFPRDMQVVGTGVGQFLCMTADRVGCSPIDQITRLPSTTPANTIMNGFFGLRVASNGCGIATNTTSAIGLSVNLGTGVVATTNTITANGINFPAINAAGTLAASTSSVSGSAVALYTVNGACNLASVDSYTAAAGGSMSYFDFGTDGRLYAAETNRNHIIVFAPTAAGLGPALTVATTNHVTNNGPVGIAAVALSTVPVGLMRFTAE